MENLEESTFFQRINDLNNEKEELKVQSEELNKDMEQELRLAQEGIRQKYSQASGVLQNKIDGKNGELDDLVESIARASFFDRSFAGVLVDLMTTYEGRKFVYQKAHYNTQECKILTMDKEFVDVTKSIEVIVLEEAKDNDYNDSYLNRLLDKGQIVVLQMSKNFLPEFCFYEANTKNHSLVFLAKMDKCEYLKEFIDMVIDWKVQNNYKYIPDNKLIELEREFLRKNKGKILLNYNMRSNEERKILEQHQEERKNNLNKKLLLNNN